MTVMRIGWYSLLKINDCFTTLDLSPVVLKMASNTEVLYEWKLIWQNSSTIRNDTRRTKTTQAHILKLRPILVRVRECSRYTFASFPLSHKTPSLTSLAKAKADEGNNKDYRSSNIKVDIVVPVALDLLQLS